MKVSHKSPYKSQGIALYILDIKRLIVARGGVKISKFRGWIKPIIFITVLTILFVLFTFSPLKTKIQDPSGFAREIEGYTHVWGLWFYPLFILVFIITAALMIPASFMVTLGSLLFGSLLGSLMNIIGTVLGAAAAFLIGRYFLGDLARKFENEKLVKWQEKIEKNGFTVILYLRLVFFPYVVLNYGASATSITFSDFFWGTLIGQIPNILIVTFFISAIKEVITEWNGFYTLIRLDFIIPFILFVSGFFVPKLIKRLFERRLIENNTPK